jgi:hypothetical protein
MPSLKEQLQATHTAALEKAEKFILAEMTKIEEEHERTAQFARISHALAALASEIDRTRKTLRDAVIEELKGIARKSPEEMTRESGESGE